MAQDEFVLKPEPRNGRGLQVVAALVALAVLAGGGYFAYDRFAGRAPQATAATSATPVPAQAVVIAVLPLRDAAARDEAAATGLVEGASAERVIGALRNQDDRADR